MAGYQIDIPCDGQEWTSWIKVNKGVNKSLVNDQAPSPDN